MPFCSNCGNQLGEKDHFCNICGSPAGPTKLQKAIASIPSTGTVEDLATRAGLAPKNTDPIVIVVHGIGGGDRKKGWSKDVEKNWGLGDLKEATFSYEGRSEMDSYLDFSQKTGEWARRVRNQIRKIVDDNPGRPLMIVSHSWGTVATKMALMGGRGPDEIVAGINEPHARGPGVEVKVDKWITLGSPLGMVEKDKLRKIVVASGKPRCVKDWTNMYDSADQVSRESHKLGGAENIKVKSSGPRTWFNAINSRIQDPVGIEAHTGIWTNKDVKKKVTDSYNKLKRDAGYLPDKVSGTLVITGMHGGTVTGSTTHKVSLIKTKEDSTHYYGRIEERSIPKGNTVVIEKSSNVLKLTYKLRGPFAPKVLCESAPTIRGHYAGLMKSLDRKNVPQVQIGNFMLSLDL